MPGRLVYESSLPWISERPETLVITCVDGRWYAHFQEFARTALNTGPRTDFIAVPGGIEPLVLVDLVPKDFTSSAVESRRSSRCMGHGASWQSLTRIVRGIGRERSPRRRSTCEPDRLAISTEAPHDSARCSGAWLSKPTSPV